MQGEHSALILYNDKGEILLQLRSAYKKRFAHHWGFFGGGIQEGETSEEALIREMQEELSYIVTRAEKFKIAESDPAAGLPPLHLFSELYTGGSITLDPLESQEMRWFTDQEIKLLTAVIPADQREVLEFCEYLKTKGQGS